MNKKQPCSKPRCVGYIQTHKIKKWMTQACKVRTTGLTLIEHILAK
jgi:hypothetical protein